MSRDIISLDRLNHIIDSFKFEGIFKSYIPYGCGHINDTFLFLFVKDSKEYKYIVQRINSNIFKDIKSLMRNFELVTSFLSEKIKRTQKHYDRQFLELVYTYKNTSYIESEGEYFRSFVFIDNATAHEQTKDPVVFYQVGRAFGSFSNLLSDFNPDLLYESLPDFHNTKVRFDKFLDVLGKDKYNRVKLVKKEIEFTIEHKNIIDIITKRLESLELKTRVTHNDTKLNNVMIDDVTNKALAVIDLDTVMKGSILYDFGDVVRFACNTAKEDEKDLEKVNVNMELFKILARGYLDGLDGAISPLELSLLHFAPVLMTFECGMRFLTDYLDGDNYFKIKYEAHNLDRTRNQYKLVYDMEKNIERLKETVQKISENREK